MAISSQIADISRELFLLLDDPDVSESAKNTIRDIVDIKLPELVITCQSCSHLPYDNVVRDMVEQVEMDAIADQEHESMS